MTCYTQFRLHAQLNATAQADSQAAVALEWLFDQSRPMPDRFPDHPFWRAKNFSSVGLRNWSAKSDPEYSHPNINIDCAVNHNGIDHAIEKFLDWLTPYVESVNQTHYELEAAWERRISSIEVKFQETEQGAKQFALIQHYFTESNLAFDYTPDPDTKWVKDYRDGAPK